MLSNDKQDSDAQPDRLRDRLPIARRDYLRYTGAAAIGSLAATGGTTAQRNNQGRDKREPTALQADYEHEPNNLPPSREPQLSWRVPQGTQQGAYRLLVADSVSALLDKDSNVWDSGKVKSTQSTGIAYTGPSLEADTTYHWAVRIWDEEGNATGWSKPASFTVALLGDSKYWNGEWIGMEASSPNKSRPGENWTDYTFDVEFVLLREAVGFAFRATDEDNLYLWQISDSQLDLRIREQGNWNTIDEIDVGEVFEEEGVLQRVQIRVEGDRITTTINGEQVDSRTDSTFSSGTIGFVQDWNEDIRVKSVAVTGNNGDILFSDDFEHILAEHFDGGAIRKGDLALRGNHIVLLGEAHDHPAPLLRRDFDIKKDVESARVHICGLGFYELSLNGEKIGERVLDPGRTDYEETVLYSTYDVADKLRSGSNTLGVILGRGRFSELIENEWEWEEAPWTSEPQLLLQFNIDFADGTSTAIVSNKNWSVTEGPIQFDSLYEGEIYDARKEKSEWSMPEYNDGEWKRPRLAEPPKGDFSPQRIQPINVSNTIKPVERTEPEDGVYVFDIGQLVSGWTELTVEGAEGTVVKLVHGEKLRDDGTVNNDNNSLPLPMGRDAYILSGSGTETWEPRFTYRGFRYVQIEGYPGTPSQDDIRAKVAHSQIDKNNKSRFECSNELLNQIQENTRWAYLNNMHSVPEDTPTYEKNGWTGDALVTAETGMYNFDMVRFWRKWLRDCRDAQVDTQDTEADVGNLPVIVPTPGFGYDDYWTPDPGWQSALILIPWWGYKICGNEHLLEENYEAMSQYLEYLNQYADDHIIRRGRGDWAAPGGRWPPKPAPDIISTSFYYRNAQVMAQTAEVLGHADEVTKHKQLSDRIRVALNEEYLDEDAGYYRSRKRDSDDWLGQYRQTDNVLPLAFGIVPAKHEDAVAANLADNVMETHNGHLNTGLHGTKYLLPVLSEYGYHEAAYTVATQTDYPSWGYWIKNDATALLELWSPEKARSYSHHFLGSVSEWFYQYVAGIRKPVEPGFKHIEIAPELVASMDWAEARTDTVRGTIASRWERTETPGKSRTRDGLTLDMTIPGNSTGTVRIPTLGGEKVRVRESRQTIWINGHQIRSNHPGVKSVKRDGDAVVVEVGSGDYEFELEQIGNSRGNNGRGN